MRRRDFLSLCAGAGLGFAAPVGPSFRLRAEEPDPAPYAGPYYVVFNASGGWDTTYLMDPKGTNGINRLYEEGDILVHGNHHFAPTAEHIEAGLANETFFERYGDELLVLNGLDYSVNNHSPCSRYMATGKLDSLAYPTFAALVAACRGAEAPLAFLTFGQYSATGNLVPMARVPYLQSLNLLANADGVEGSTRHTYHDDFVTDRIESTLKEQMADRVSEVRLPRVERAQNMLYAAQLNSKALERVTPHVPKERSKNRLAQQSDIALAAFKAGVCVSANLSIGQFDSHAENDRDQLKLLPELLEGIDDLLVRAETLGLRDQLVVVVQSEMGRTPTYNDGKGKDHWSIGSAMFLGRGIRGNRVVGRTDGKQLQVPLDPMTLATIDQTGAETPDTEPTGIRVRPEHVHTALRELAGIAEHPFATQFPLAVPEAERLRGLWD